MASGGNADTFQVSAQLLLTYFVSYTLLGIVGVSVAWQWFPLTASVPDLVDHGFTLDRAVLVIFGIAETTLAMFLALIWKTLFPGSLFHSRLFAPVVKVLENVLIFNVAMAGVHYVIFTDKFAEAIRITISVVVLIPAVLSAFAYLHLGISSKLNIGKSATNAFLDFLKNSTIAKLLFSALSVTLLVLFILILLELTVGVQNLFTTARSVGVSFFAVVLIMLFGFSLIGKAIRQ